MRILLTSSSLLPKPSFSVSKPSKVNGSFSELIPKMGFGTVKVSPYMVTMALLYGNRTFLYRDEGTASVSWIYGHPKSILKHKTMFRT